jgi:hypothetical protein
MVIRAVLTTGQPLPVYTDNRTFSDFGDMFQGHHGTKSLRSSPLRGGKNRETGSQLRGQHWRV